MKLDILWEKREYLIIAGIIVVITTGNYYLSGGAKSNWVEVSDYGFSLLHPPNVNVWTIGLDEENVFDIYGGYRPTMESGMIGYNLDNVEYAVTWVTLGEPSFEEILEVHYHSGEVNSIRRDRGFRIETEPMTYGSVNGHEAGYQIHLFELDMPDVGDPLFAKGEAVGWTCTETGVSFVVYALHWNTGAPPNIGDAQIRRSLNYFLENLECH